MRHGHGLFSIGIKALGNLMKIGAKTGIKVAKKPELKYLRWLLKS